MIIDLFSGIDGWTRDVPDLEAVGFEHDADACATRAELGLATVRADIASYPLRHFATGSVEGLIASPPCPDFSTAGNGAGVDGETGRLILEVPRWVHALRPRWVACEQVPPALEWWERFAWEFRQAGYATWCGVLNAADYGVPQTRRRAILLASLDRQPGPPPATHAQYPMPTLFGEELLPWVSMGEALGWWGPLADDPARTLCGHNQPAWIYDVPPDVVPTVGLPRLDDTGSSPDGYRARDMRSVDRPSKTLGAISRSWLVNTGRDWKPGGTRDTAQVIDPAEVPAPTLDRNAGHWRVEGYLDRPATTVCGDPRLQPPGHKVNAEDLSGGRSYDGRAGANALRLSIGDALILQGFHPSLPLQGTRTAQFRQVGNAVPPPLGRAALDAVRGPR